MLFDGAGNGKQPRLHKTLYKTYCASDYLEGEDRSIALNFTARTNALRDVKVTRLIWMTTKTVNMPGPEEHQFIQAAIDKESSKGLE